MDNVIKLEEAIKVSTKFKKEGNTIVLAGGCFDILHQGHLTYLENAKRGGDILFVALESDETVKRLKGQARPRNTQEQRATTLALLTMVDYVILLPPFTFDREYFNMTSEIAPSIIAITQGDPKQKEKEEQAKAIGAAVVVVTKRLKKYSTTAILGKQ